MIGVAFGKHTFGQILEKLNNILRSQKGITYKSYMKTMQ